MTSDAIASLRKGLPSLDTLLLRLLEKGEVGLFGGSVRDLVISENFMNFRDLDLVVSGPSNEELLFAVHSLDFQRTQFGGYRILMNGIKVDMWALDATWAYREGLLSPTFSNLPRSAFLTVDAVVVTLGERKLYEYRFFESIKHGIIDIALRENPLPALCVLRAFVLRRKYSYYFSDPLRKYIETFWYKHYEPIKELEKMQFIHYGKRVISDAVILEDFEKYALQNQPVP